MQRGGSAWVLVANAAVLLFAESTRGLVLSSLFAFLSAAAPGCGLSATALLGAAVAAFSAGRLAASFLFGWVSERGFPYSALLQLSLLATLAGQLLYIAGDALPQGPLATSAIVFARTVVGFGSGILPTCRAVVVECSSVERRMRGLAQLSFFKYVGYAITPGLGAVLVGNVHIVGPLRFNSFTMPAWLSVVLCVVGIAMVRATFDPAFHSGKEMGKAPAPTPMEGDDVAPLVVASPLSLRFWMSLHGPIEDPATPLIFWAFVLFVFLNFATKGALASAEASLAPQFAQAVDTASSDQIVSETATFALDLGLVGLASYLLLALKPLRAPRSAYKVASALDPPSANGLSDSLLECETAPSDDVAAARAPPASTWPRVLVSLYDWAAVNADDIDFWLLVLSLVLTLAGSLLVAPLDWSGRKGVAEQPVALPTLALGMSLLWSLGAPMCDVLAVSLFSVIYSSVRPGASQAAYMGYVSAAGAVGRILFPGLVGVLGLVGNMLLVALSSAVGAAASVAYFAAYRSVPGAGWARRLWGDERTDYV